ncbi:hypothetical protein [Microtetraspora sp. NBRC 16547]|nr:hypothetical protein [Microtetraspora sp. NBRC 16547]
MYTTVGRLLTGVPVQEHLADPPADGRWAGWVDGTVRASVR